MQTVLDIDTINFATEVKTAPGQIKNHTIIHIQVS